MAEARSKILIVDNNRVNRLLMSRRVELVGHEVAVAENGRIALARLGESDFGLVLLDIEMPEMDGFEVLEALKRKPGLRDIAIIMTSSIEGIDNIVRCIELDAEDDLPKPANRVLIQARLFPCPKKKRVRGEQNVLLERFATTVVARELEATGFAFWRRHVAASVLFCDFPGFTQMSENQPPEETIELPTLYYALMFEAVGSQGGIVSIVIRDGLMVFFGVPRTLEHPARSAMAAALIDRFSLERRSVGKAKVRIGNGIATEDLVAGCAGSQRSATYTCVGDCVNLAGRLEAHMKVAGRSILIDDATRSILSAQVNLRALEKVVFKGFLEPQTVIEIGAVQSGSKLSQPLFCKARRTAYQRFGAQKMRQIQRQLR